MSELIREQDILLKQIKFVLVQDLVWSNKFKRIKVLIERFEKEFGVIDHLKIEEE